MLTGGRSRAPRIGPRAQKSQEFLAVEAIAGESSSRPPFDFHMEINGETRHFNNTLNLTAVIPEPDAAWLPPDRECGDPERPESEAELIAVPLLAWQALLHLQEVAARVATPRLAVGSSAVAGSCAKRSGSSRLHGVKKLYTHWPPIAGHGAGDSRKILTGR